MLVRKALNPFGSTECSTLTEWEQWADMKACLKIMKSALDFQHDFLYETRLRSLRKFQHSSACGLLSFENMGIWNFIPKRLPACQSIGKTSIILKTPSRSVVSLFPQSVVISGIAGRFGRFKSYEEFRNKYLSPESAVMDGTNPNVLQGLNKFDSEFFSLDPKIAETTDPQLRLLLTVTIEALIDAGLNPGTLKSQKVGIYSNLTGYQDLIAKYIQKTELTADGSRIECNFDLLYNSILTVNYRTFDTVILAGITAHPAAVSLVLQRQTEAARAYAVVDRQHSLDGPASSAGDLVDIVKAVAAIQNSVTATTTDSPTSAAAPPPEDWPVVQNNAVLLPPRDPRVVLTAQPVPQEKSYASQIPVMLPLSGRSKPSVISMLEKHGLPNAHNPEFRSLLQGTFGREIKGHNQRAFAVVKPGQKTGTVYSQSSVLSKDRRPVWFIFPGMGSQWAGMGREMMRIDAFAESFLKSKKCLQGAGMDLDEILKPSNRIMFRSIRAAFVSIGSIMIALVDCLKSLGITPDGMVGHSAGEIAAGYADGGLTAEEAILFYEARGRAFEETQKEAGAMAAVSLSWAQVQKKLPPAVYAACSNSAKNVSVSGNADAISKFVDKLDSEGVMAVEVNTCNTAPHSPFAFDASDKMLGYYSEILGAKKEPRSARWVSTSVIKGQEGNDDGCASAHYFANNARVPVFFYEALQSIPENAMLFEVAPKKALTPLINQSIKPGCRLFTLMDHAAKDHVYYFLNQIGTAYLSGVDLDLRGFYPQLPSPLSSATFPISHLVTWDHSKTWPVVGTVQQEK